MLVLSIDATNLVPVLFCEENWMPAETPTERTAQASRPSAAAFRSPTLLSMHAAGWLLLICMWLPVNRGCNGAVMTPIEQLQLNSPYSLVDLLGDLWILGSYGNGLLAASILAASALWRSERLWWNATLIQGFATFCLSAAAIVVLGVNEPDPKSVVTNLLVYFVPWILSLTWIATALYRGQRQAAWARLQHSWALVGAFGLQLRCIFSTELFYGYWLSLIGFAALLLAVEFARYRMAHDLWDPTLLPVKPQVSLRKFLAWTTFSAVVIAYYQSIQPLLNWLFPD